VKQSSVQIVVKEVREYLRGLKSRRLVIYLFAGSSLILLAVVLSSFLSLLLSFFLGLSGAALLSFFLYRRDLLSGVEQGEALKLLDQRLGLKERFITLAELEQQLLEAPTADPDPRIEYLKSELEAGVDSFNIKDLPQELPRSDKFLVLLAVLILFVSLAIFPFSGFSPPHTPGINQINAIENLISEGQDLPEEVRDRLEDVVEAIKQDGLTSQSVSQAVERAEQAIAQAEADQREAEQSDSQFPETETAPTPEPTPEPTPNEEQDSEDQDQPSDPDQKQEEDDSEPSSEDDSSKQDQEQQGDQEQQEASKGQGEGQSDQDGEGGSSKQEKESEQSEGEESGESKGDGQEGQGEGESKGESKGEDQSQQQDQGAEQEGEQGSEQEGEQQGEQQGGLSEAKQALEDLKESAEQARDQESQEQDQQSEQESKQPGQSESEESKLEQEMKQENKGSEQQDQSEQSEAEDQKTEQESATGSKSLEDSDETGDNSEGSGASLPNPDEASEFMPGDEIADEMKDAEFKEQIIGDMDEITDPRFGTSTGEIVEHEGEQDPLTELENVELLRPEPAKDPSKQPIPLEYREILR